MNTPAEQGYKLFMNENGRKAYQPVDRDGLGLMTGYNGVQWGSGFGTSGPVLYRGNQGKRRAIMIAKKRNKKLGSEFKEVT